ncbi:GDSL esterase/lipase At5g03980 [Linum perenne]
MEGKSFFPLVPYSLLLLLLPPLPSSSSTTPDLKPCGFKAIYNFGDSLSDTGNEEVESSDPHAWKYPPGMPIGGVATGRFCDGLLIIDRIALQDHLKSSLIMIAGGSVNDYYNLQNMTGIPNLERKIMIMPDVMKSIRDALQKFIRYGATKIIVTGLIEGGCLPMYYNGVDKLHCDREANEYHNLHNQLLQQEIGLLGRMFPNVSIVYGDIWSANQWILDHYTSLGFISPQKQCCGTKYQGCGNDGSPYCKKPSEYVHWDYAGHFTDAAYNYMYDLMIPQLSLGLKCHSKKNDEP